MKASNDVLLEKIENLTNNVAEGFKGVHDRQDTANHATAKNTKYRIQSETTLSTLKWLAGSGFFGMIVLIIREFLL